MVRAETTSMKVGITVLVIAAVATAAMAQTPADGWSGQLQCVQAARGASGYQHDETHIWVLSGAPIARRQLT